MSTQTVIDSDISLVLETIILDELEFEPPCDGNPHNDPEPCSRVAEWQILFSCGHGRLFCTGHKDRAVDLQAAGIMRCYQCIEAKDFDVRTIVFCERISGA